MRSSIEAVTTWLVDYRRVMATTAAMLQASQCISATAASLLQAQPTVIVANGQSFAITPVGPDNSTGTGSVITAQTPQSVQPPPPRIRNNTAPAVTPAEPPADISNKEFDQLRDLFALKPTNATSPNSTAFHTAVNAFQRCRGQLPPTGVLTSEQKASALSGADSACLPPKVGTSPAAAPSGPAPSGNPLPPPPGKH